MYIYINQEDDNIYDVNNVRMTQVHDAYYISTYVIWLVEKINSKKVKLFKGEYIYLTTSSSSLSTKDDYILTAISSSLVVQ